MYNRSSGKGLAVLALVIIAAIMLLVSFATQERSTAGVTEPTYGTIRLPAGETAILTRSCGKSCIKTWRITYDGANTVTFTGSWFSEHTETRLEQGETKRANIDFLASLDVSLKDDGAAYITYPYGFLSGWYFIPH